MCLSGPSAGTSHSTVERRRVLPEVQPGYLRDMLPNCAPTHAEHWTDIMADVEHAIMPGVIYSLSLSLLEVLFEPFCPVDTVLSLLFLLLVGGVAQW